MNKKKKAKKKRKEKQKSRKDSGNVSSKHRNLNAMYGFKQAHVSVLFH